MYSYFAEWNFKKAVSTQSEKEIRFILALCLSESAYEMLEKNSCVLIYMSLQWRFKVSKFLVSNCKCLIPYF
jgi:hypothetical protein